MPIPSTIESLSTTAASNGPAGSEQRTIADDGLRQAYAFIRQLVTLGSNIASASSITPPSTGSSFNITGTTSITAIASTNSWDGRVVTFIFAGALTLTHSANLALPGSANITTAANDTATFIQTGSGAWRLLSYGIAAGAYLPLTGGTLTGTLNGTVANFTGGVTLGDAVGDTITIGGGSSKNATGNWTFAAPSSGDTATFAGLTSANSNILLATSANIGFANSLSLVNSDNTNTGSNSVVNVQVGGASGGDAVVQYTISGGQQWRAGIDNSDSDKYKISASAALGTNDTLSITTAGNIACAAPSAGVGFTGTGFAGSDAFVYNGGTSGTAKITTTGGLSTNAEIRATGSASTIGYGTGAGGTVTQATSKSTAVTLNKATGQITMNGAALAANTTVSFTWNNTLLVSTDVVVLSNAVDTSIPSNYDIKIGGIAAGSANISVRNITAGSLSDAIVLNVAVIKAISA